MTSITSPRKARAARALALLSLAALLGCPIGCDTLERQVPSYQKGYQPAQPIKYSHKLHAGDLKIDCKYCHFGSEKSRHAGIPPVGVCMNCHRLIKGSKAPQEVQKIANAYNSGRSIEWVRIHKLPDFVFFDHSRHVNRGVRCQTCHGPVETMEVVRQENTLAMGWCVSCHREYTRNPPPHLRGKHIKAGLGCAVCHY